MKYFELKNFHYALNEEIKYYVSDLSIQEGQIAFINGLSGSGKTTLFNVISELIPSNIDKFIHTDFHHLDYIPHDTKLLPFYTVKQNLVVEGRLRNLPPNFKIFIEYCSQFQLPNILDLYPRQLSLGMKQRVQLAKALSFKPDILLLDEALAGIDAKTKSTIYCVLQDYVVDNNAIIIATSHNTTDELILANIIYFLRNNSIQAFLPIHESINDRINMDVGILFSLESVKQVLTAINTY